MKKTLQILSLVALMCIPWAVSAQTYFSEDFSSAPSGWSFYSINATDVFGGTALSTGTGDSWNYSACSLNQTTYCGLPCGHYYSTLNTRRQNMWLVTPSIDLAGVTSAQLSFNLAMTESQSSAAAYEVSSDKIFMVVVSTDDGATWSSSNATQWLVDGGDYSLTELTTVYGGYVVDLTQYIGQTIKIAFYTQSTVNSEPIDIHIDDVVVGAVPSCFRITSVSATDVLSTTATLTWIDRYNSGATYTVLNADGGTVATGITATTYNLSGLTPASANTFYVVADCGDVNGSAAAVGVSFTTMCSASQLPFFSGFESQSLDCWTMSGPLTWSIGTGDDESDPGAYSGTSNVLVIPEGSSTPSMLISPTIDLSAVDAVMLSFARLQRSFMGDLDELNVYYRTSPSDQWQLLKSYTDEVDGWTADTLLIDDGLTATCQFGFEFVDNYGHGIGLDDVKVEEAPSCPAVANVAVSELSGNGITITWVDAEQRNVTYSVYDGNTLLATTAAGATSYTMTQFSYNTAYTLTVVANCNSVVASDPASVSFTTPCSTVDIPYSENFNSYSGNSTSTTVPTGYPSHTMPDCWNFLNMSTSSSSYPQAFLTSSSSYIVDGNCLFFKSSSTTPMYAVLPQTTADLGTLRLSLTYRNEGTGISNGTLSIGYMTDASDASTFVSVRTLDQTTTLTTVTVDFSANTPSGARAAVCYTGGSSDNYYASIDNVVLQEQPSCLEPANVAVTAVTTNTVTISWTDNNGGTADYYIYDAQGGLACTTAVGATTATIGGLTTATTYAAGTYTIKANCGNNGMSDAANVPAFTTECEAVTQFPWNEDFESYASGNFTADCWVNEHIEGSGTYIFTVSTTTNGTNSTHQMQLPDMTSGTKTKLRLPKMTINGDYLFSIDVYRNTTYYASEGVRVYASATGSLEGATEMGFLYRNYTQTDNGVVTAEDASGSS